MAKLPQTRHWAGAHPRPDPHGNGPGAQPSGREKPLGLRSPSRLARGQLHAVEAVRPLLDLIPADDDDPDDWINEEYPQVFSLIGPAALPELIAGLHDPTKDSYTRWLMADCLVRMASDHPACRDECVSALTRELESGSRNPGHLNGGIVSALMDLEAVEAGSVMERAFAAGYVDESIAGGWLNVAFELGLTDEPPPQPWVDTPAGSWRDPLLSPGPARTPKEKAKARAKKKRAKKTRQRNRKRKK